jgi:hypothetical protein
VYNKLFACVGQKLRIFNLYQKEAPRNRMVCELNLSARGSLDFVGACDMCFVESEELMVVLQSNLCIRYDTTPLAPPLSNHLSTRS